MAEHDIHERAAGIFAPDTLLASQYFDRVRRRKDLTGEQRLLIAVLDHAVDDYMKHAAATDPRRRALFAEVERWVESPDRSWLYAFETICDHLGLDCDWVRRGLQDRRARARAVGVPASADVAVVATDECRRASNE